MRAIIYRCTYLNITGKLGPRGVFFASAIIHRRETPTTVVYHYQLLRLPRARVTNTKPFFTDAAAVEQSPRRLFYFYSECVWCASVRAQLTAPAVPRGNQVPRNEVNEITDRCGGWRGRCGWQGREDGRTLCLCVCATEFSRIRFERLVPGYTICDNSV